MGNCTIHCVWLLMTCNDWPYMRLQGALEEAQLITWPRPQKVGRTAGLSVKGGMSSIIDRHPALWNRGAFQ